nr:bifunctional 3-(3-hydroxy-phenyl)propionate/3-hydroxycinnamic acid hydroxylase [Roseiarcus fermentans]
MTADVAIVGYGPTGQTLALLLGGMGHRVVAIDRWPDLYPLPRAVHFDHEIARILQAAGAIDDVLPVLDEIDTYQWRNADHEMLLELDWRGLGPSGWPVSNIFSQPELEAALDARVKATPSVDVRQGWSAKRLAQDADGVRVEVERGEMRDGQWVATGETGRLQARYVIGCDGANSFVRRAIGVETHDLGFAFDWLVVDVKPRERREWTPKTWQLCDPRRPTTIVPGGPGRRRWEFMLLPGETAADMNRREVAWRLLEPWGMTPGTAELERHAVYTFRGQWAETWRMGRALLAGDAAHLMPPFAGQGLCSGVRDSLALAWRLDAILRGLAGDWLLDSYGPERSGHVQAMIGFSIELGKVICVTDLDLARARDAEMIAARTAPGYQPPPPPQPRLGPGLWSEGAPGAGLLGVQARVEVDGRSGLFDDVFGVRFALFARDCETLASLSAASRDALARWNVAVVDLSLGIDVTGAYRAWLDRLGCVAAFVRPDFYLQGGARDGNELERLIGDWRRRVEGLGESRAPAELAGAAEA